MSIKSDLIVNTVKTVTESVPNGIRSIRNTFSKKLTPDEQAAFDIQLSTIEKELTQAQTEINKVEAGSGRLFVAGWRPAIGWLCAAVLGFNYIIRPIVAIWTDRLPELDISMLYPLLIGMLGIGGLRTYEKAKGVVNNH